MQAEQLYLRAIALCRREMCVPFSLLSRSRPTTAPLFLNAGAGATTIIATLSVLAVRGVLTRYVNMVWVAIELRLRQGGGLESDVAVVGVAV